MQALLHQRDVLIHVRRKGFQPLQPVVVGFGGIEADVVDNLLSVLHAVVGRRANQVKAIPVRLDRGLVLVLEDVVVRSVGLVQRVARDG